MLTKLLDIESQLSKGFQCCWGTGNKNLVEFSGGQENLQNFGKSRGRGIT